ncbi:hypothetical protein PBI_THONKO_74 [Mycobacterium phage Thonko]|uniref:Uncharacterized protein n=1 Tax=Mycobacterium phage Thonko TaxID=2282910 RepID=A0A346FCC0_9CAUD|nr:hypothetical protein I5G57_gp074 [Mycobacterium phage Thonko]AXN53345.1 hypothetical protein PBI_THONKO_74 [Mycobacterium phage Thonko]
MLTHRSELVERHTITAAVPPWARYDFGGTIETMHRDAVMRARIYAESQGLELLGVHRIEKGGADGTTEVGCAFNVTVARGFYDDDHRATSWVYSARWRRWWRTFAGLDIDSRRTRRKAIRDVLRADTDARVIKFPEDGPQR